MKTCFLQVFCNTSRPITCLSFLHWHPIGCEWSLLQQEEGHSKKAPLSPTVTLKCQLKAFRCKVQFPCCAGPAGCGGRRRAPGGAGPGRPAGLLGCWATGRPRRGLAGWASSMERLIPARTKSLPVVLLDQQQQKKELRVTATNTVVLH